MKELVKPIKLEKQGQSTELYGENICDTNYKLCDDINICDLNFNDETGDDDIIF
jgi:hypothetical protein